MLSNGGPPSTDHYPAHGPRTDVSHVASCLQITGSWNDACNQVLWSNGDVWNSPDTSIATAHIVFMTHLYGVPSHAPAHHAHQPHPLRTIQACALTGHIATKGKHSTTYLQLSLPLSSPSPHTTAYLKHGIVQASPAFSMPPLGRMQRESGCHIAAWQVCCESVHVDALASQGCGVHPALHPGCP